MGALCASHFEDEKRLNPRLPSTSDMKQRWTKTEDGSPRWARRSVQPWGCPPLHAESAGPAASFPNKPVRLIIPFAAGGGTDIVGRVVAMKPQEAWGQPFVVDNMAGDNALIHEAGIKGE